MQRQAHAKDVPDRTIKKRQKPEKSRYHIIPRVTKDERDIAGKSSNALHFPFPFAYQTGPAVVL